MHEKWNGVRYSGTSEQHGEGWIWRGVRTSSLVMNFVTQSVCSILICLNSTDRGASVIERSLTLTLGSDPEVAAAKMLANYNTLDYRPSLIERLSARPSPLLCPILVVHGTEDKAVRHFLNHSLIFNEENKTIDSTPSQYPFERLYHERTVAAIGELAELFVVEKGPHFVTVTHSKEVDAKIIEWITRNGH
jgi:pimeloyl-ACP methyl ester carboxylesterase